MQRREIMARHIVIYGLAAWLLLAPLPVLAGGFARVGTYAFQYQHFNPDARTEMLAGANLATASGPAAIWSSPAPLREGHALQAGYHFYDYVADINFSTLALAGEWRWLRWGICRGGLDMDPLIVRTAYAPEGTGGIFDADSHIWVIGGSVDIGRWLMPDAPHAQLSVGMCYRNYHGTLGEQEATAGDIDIGTTARWRRDLPKDRWFGFACSLGLRNALGEKVTFDELPTQLGQFMYLGMACEGGLGSYRHGDTLRWMLAYAHREFIPSSAGALEDANRYGLELVFIDLLAFREGYDTSRFGGSWSYGFGVIMQAPEFDPLSLTIDYARTDHRELGGWRALWSITLRVNL
jgi:hypothetical protein